MTPMDTAYRKNSAAGATGISLLIAIFDTLAGDLRRAAEAERHSRLEQRCNALNHALMVIGVLEDRISYGNGGLLAEQLTDLYQRLRRTILLAQARRSPELLDGAMADVLKVREVWQSIELRQESSSAIPQWSHGSAAATADAASQQVGSSFSWSA